MSNTTKKWVAIVTGALVLLVIVGGLSGHSPQQQPKAQSKKSIPTQAPQTGTLTADQKIKVVAILTANVEHYKKLWQDGKDALGTTQYANSYDGLAALDDPNSAASKFSAYKKAENPVNDNTMIDAMNQADNFYPSSVSDQPLHTWSDDVEQVSIDMGKWVSDATSWQIQAVGDGKLSSDSDTINQDLVTVQKDIDAIGE